MSSPNEIIVGNSLSESWLIAAQYLRDQGGSATNLCVRVAEDAVECSSITAAIDRALLPNRSPAITSVRKIADTIFPASLYQPRPNDKEGEARNHLYKMQALRRKVLLRDGYKPSYFDRFVAWPALTAKRKGMRQLDGTPFNQLETNIINGLLTESKKECQRANHMELASEPVDLGQELSAFNPERDRAHQGTPCLSHVSFSLEAGKVVLTAIYRNHFYISRAYGNLVGLRDLQRFVATETGFPIGELLCVSTHADLYEGGRISKTRIHSLISSCESILSASQNGQGAQN